MTEMYKMLGDKLGGFSGIKKKMLLSQLMHSSSIDSLEPMLKDTDWLKEGPEYLAAATAAGNVKVAELCLSRGCIDQPVSGPFEASPKYRVSPYVI
jgi:hypothetical protein